MAAVRNVLAVVMFTVAALGTVSKGEERAPSHHFIVEVSSGHDLGSWSKVSGLDVTWDIAEYRSYGAANVSRPFFPANTKYGTVKLTRAASSETDLVFVWLRDVAAAGHSATIEITLVDSSGNRVVRWQMEGVQPRQYTVGGTHAKGTDAAVETLVLSHEGLSVVCAREC